MNYRLNIAAIQRSLLAVQGNFTAINQSLTDKRDPLSDKVIVNMLDGYRLIDSYLAEKLNPFELGSSRYLLEVNQVVLCGGDAKRNQCSHQQYNVASDYFYSSEGCLNEVMEWLALNIKRCVWYQAAGLLSQILSRPQLFIEGNHRTAALLMSYILVQCGEPPFVLTTQNARFFFEPASRIKKLTKTGLDGMLRLPRTAESYSQQLAGSGNGSFLCF